MGWDWVRWRRRQRQASQWEGPPSRVPDGDTIPIPGHGRWVDLLAAEQVRREAKEKARREAAEGHTRILPIITRGQRHRGNGGRS